MNAIKIPPVQAPRFTRMNLDVDVRGLAPGEYRRLINGINIGPMGLEGLDGVISNIVGTEQVTNANLESTSTVLGYLEDPANNRGFFFVLHGGGNHTIYQISGSTISVVMRTSLFAFTSISTSPGMIFSATIVGDLLIFSDNVTEIKMINVASALAGGIYTPTLEEIVLIKRPPQLPLTLATANDAGVSSNYIFKHYFQFYYRYIYHDNEASVLSAISIADRPDPISETNHNAIDVTIPAGEVIPATVKQIDYAVRVDGSNEYVIYRSDLPATWISSRTHRFYNTELRETLPDNVSVKWNDSIPLKSAAIRFFENRLFCLNNTEGYEYPISDIAGATFNVASGSGNGRGSKGRGIYPVGLMFFDNYGRHAGVHRLADVTIPERTYSLISRHNIEWDLTGITALTVIPTWATHYAIVVGECKNIGWFLQHQAADVHGYDEQPDGTVVYSRSDTQLSKYLAIDIIGLSQRNIGYTFNDGDRIILYGSTLGSGVPRIELRIVKQDGRFVIAERGGFLFGNFENSRHDPGGLGTGSDLAAYTPVFEIYQSKSSVGDIYSEIGKKYAIASPGTGSRDFGTMTGSYEGDIEKQDRGTYSYNNSFPPTYSPTDPYSNTMEFVSTEDFEMMNAYDDYFDKWVKGTGRSIARLSQGSKELQKKNALRFGQEYFLNSSLNQVATFEALDEQNLPSEGGAGMALGESGDVLVAIQYAQTSGVYVGQGFVKTTNGNNFLTKTDNVIGDVNKNLGDHGCQHPYTVVCREGRVYYLDMRRGYVIRRSQDGLTRISDYGMRTFFADICRNFRETVAADNMRIIAGWDPKYECYIIQFQKIFDPSATHLATVYFHEKTNSWVCFQVNYPEFYGTLGTRKLDFSGGQLWRQTNNTNFNNWFGNQVYRTLHMEIGADSEEKIWAGIEVDIDSIYTPATPATLLKFLAPNASWTETSSSPDATLGATTISRNGTGVCSARQALIVPPGGTVRFSVKISITVGAAVATGATLTARLNSTAPTPVVYSTGPLVAGSNEFVVPFEFTNLDAVNTTTLELLAQRVDAGSADIVITIPVGQVLYETLSSNEDVVLLYHKNDGVTQTKINFRDFRQRGSAWRSAFFGYISDPNFNSETESKYKSSQKVRGQSAYIIINGRSTVLNPMKSVTVLCEHSPLTYR